MKKMIYVRLQELLDERNTTLTEVAKGTGLSYQGLWKLINRKTAGIDFRTLEALCNHFKVQVNRIVSYAPDP